MPRAVPIVLGLVALALAAPARARDGFVDPLDEPSAVSPLAPRRLLNAAAFAGQRMVAAGQRGHIVFSDDQGKTWTQAHAPGGSDPPPPSFPPTQPGRAGGH